MRAIGIFFMSIVALTVADAQGGAFDTPAAVVDSITASVTRSHPSGEGERFLLSPGSALDDMSWGDGDKIVELVPPTNPSRVGRMTYLIRIRRDNRLVAKAIVVEVRRQVRSLVLERDLKRGTPVTGADVRSEWVDVTYRHGEPLTHASSLVSVSMKRSGRTGDLLTREMIEPSPAIRVGDRVTILYERSGFTIALDGVAWEDGLTGEAIRVKNSRSGRILTATVVKAGVVRL